MSKLDKISLKQGSWLDKNWLILRGNIVSILYQVFSSHYRTIKRSGLFDKEYYLKTNSEINSFKENPLIHYIKCGWREGRQPNELFNGVWYSEKNPESVGMDPLLHYIRSGSSDGKDPTPYFSTSYYAEQYPEYINKNTTPLAHYIHTGWCEGKNPNPSFDSDGYLEQNPDVAEADMNPLNHYISYGIREGRQYLPFFDVDFYMEDNPSAGNVPVLHYIRHGAREGRSPNRFFDPIFYRDTYVKESLSEVDIYLHYAQVGSKKHYRPCALFDPRFYENTYPEYKGIERFPLFHYQTLGIAKGYYPCREVAELPRKPVVSIVTPVYNTDELLLRKCIHSVLYQAYPHWELCLIDDGSDEKHVKRILKEYAKQDRRIKVNFISENRGISDASNAAAAMATGEYIGFLDHDDELTLNALYKIVGAINNHNSDILYSDEDLVNREGRYLHSFYKPDYNPELLMSHNYINHFVVTKRGLFERAGGFSKECDGAQDYDLLLKLTEQTEKVHHIAQTLYHWRAIETSTSLNHTQKIYADVAGRKALESALQRREIEATVKPVKPGYYPYHYSVERKLLTHPSVSLLLVVRDNRDEVEKWINSIVQSTKYPHVEFLCLFLEALNDEMSTSVNAIDPRMKIQEFKGETNMSKILNQAVDRTQGKHLLFLEQNTEPCNSDWIEILLGYSQKRKTGTVGGLVQFSETNNLQVDALPDLENNTWAYYRAYFQVCSRHLNGLFCAQNVLVVSTDLCMVKRNIFEAVNGFDEDELINIMYDSDFSLRVRKKGVENVYTPSCKAVCKKKIAPFVSNGVATNELAIFRRRWKDLLSVGDPYYNINRILNADSISRQKWKEWFTGISMSD